MQRKSAARVKQEKAAKYSPSSRPWRAHRSRDWFAQNHPHLLSVTITHLPEGRVKEVNGFLILPVTSELVAQALAYVGEFFQQLIQQVIIRSATGKLEQDPPPRVQRLQLPRRIAARSAHGYRVES
jgi:hypothetical protein